MLDVDAKRLQLFLEMRDATGVQLSVQESLLLHVEQAAGPKVAPFPDPIRDRIEALRADQARLAPPERRSRAIAIGQR